MIEKIHDHESDHKDHKHDHKKSVKYTYDVFGNLKKVQLGKHKTIEYLIDGQNRRVGKLVNGKFERGYVYQSQTQIAAEINSKGQVEKRFIYASKSNIPDYMIKNGKEYKIISDQVGTPQMLVDVSSGKIVE